MNKKIFFLLFAIVLVFYNCVDASKYLIQEENQKSEISPQPVVTVEKPTVKLYTFSFKEMPISKVFKVLSNEKVNFVYEKTSLSQQQTTTSSSSSSTSTTQTTQQTQTIMPSLPQLQSQQSDMSELDNIYITLFLENVSLDDAILYICRSGDIYCEKIDENKYLIKKYQTHTVNIGAYFDNYSLDIRPGLSGRSNISTTSTVSTSLSQTTGTSSSGSNITSASDSFQINENVNNFYNDIKSMLTPEGKIFYSKRGQFYIVDRPSGVKRVTEFLEKEKSQNEPIKLSVKLVEVNLSDKTSYGFDWNVFSERMQSRLGNWKLGPSKTNIGVSTSTSSIGKGFSYVFDSEKLDIFFKALGEYGNVKILRDWTVTSRMGLPVVLSDVESIPFLEEVTIIPSGSNTTTTTTTNVNYIDVGIKITILGSKIKLNTDERFEGQMQVLMSSLIDIQNLRTTDNPFYAPDVRSSSVIIPLSVKFNEILLISGFKTNKRGQTSEGLPILSKLPIIGGLFGYKKYEDSNSEFLILVEPIK